MEKQNQDYIDAMGLFIEQKNLSLSHSSMKVNHINQEIENLKAQMELQERFIIADKLVIEQETKVLNDFIKRNT